MTELGYKESEWDRSFRPYNWDAAYRFSKGLSVGAPAPRGHVPIRSLARGRYVPRQRLIYGRPARTRVRPPCAHPCCSPSPSRPRNTHPLTPPRPPGRRAYHPPQHCKKVAATNNFYIVSHIHLDDGDDRGSWRNSLIFDPSRKYGALSYWEALVKPTALAIKDANFKKRGVFFSMQAEMGATIFY